jgi:hypothetical protein
MSRDKKNTKQPLDKDVISRREMLQRIGKFSALAAGVLAAPTSALVSGCSGVESDRKSGSTTTWQEGDGASVDEALLIKWGDTYRDVRVEGQTMCFFEFRDSDGLGEIRITSFDGDSLICVVNPRNSESEGISFDTDSAVTSEPFRFRSGDILHFGAGLGEGHPVEFTITLQRVNSEGDADGGAGYDGGSEWSDSAVEWSNAPSWTDWNDAPAWSDWYDAPWSDYSDYNDYSDYWGNWMESW